MNQENLVLVEKFCDGQASPRELQQIRQLLETDPAFRSLLTEALQMRGAIRAALVPDHRCREIEELIMSAVGVEKPGAFSEKVMNLVKQSEERQGNHTAASSHPVPAGPATPRRTTGSRKRGGAQGFWSWVAAASVVLLIGAAILFQRSGPTAGPAPQPTEVARLDRITGTMTLLRQGRTRPATERDSLFHGDTLTAGAESEARVVYTDGSHTTMGDKTILKIHPGAGIALELLQGTLKSQVQPQKPGTALSVTTPHAVATVLGTVFLLEVAPGQTRLDVTQGRVGFERTSDRKSIEVTENEYAIAGAGVDLVARPTESTLDPAVAAKNDTFALVDAKSGQVIPAHDPIADNAVIDMSKLATGDLNIVANIAAPEIKHVIFAIEGPGMSGATEKTPQRARPFSVFGDNFHLHGGYICWQPANGAYCITAELYRKGSLAPARELKLRFSVINARKQ